MHKKILLFLCFVLWPLLTLAEWTADTAWVRTYNGPANATDWAEDIAVDASGNVYVTGYSFGSGTQFDYATIKYLPDGDVAVGWPRRYNGPGNSHDWAQAIAVDGSGNVCVTGPSYGSGTGDDYASIKYLPNGLYARIWPRRYNGPGNSTDWASDIAVDGSGYVYVTGASVGSGTDFDYATIKYYPDGDTAWVRRYDGPTHGDDRSSAIAVDGSGYVYVTGAGVGSGTSYDYVTIKYYPDGDTAWVRRFDGTGNDSDYAYAIAVDGSGSVYVTGWSLGNGTSHDYLTIKYLSNGNIAPGFWPARYDGPAHVTDNAYAIAVDASGYVYVTGESQWNYCTIKYHFNGDTAWVRTYNGPANHMDISRAIALDDSGNVYVTGVSAKTYVWPLGNIDFATIKYHPNGETDWINRYNGPADDWDNAFALALDESANIYVTGYSVGFGTELDYATIKYVNLEFLRGDANGDGEINVSDVVYLSNYFYRGGPPPYPWEAGDADCDGDVDEDDMYYLIDYLFRSGPPPVC